MFKKPGRPPEDRLARRQEIYDAARPLLLAYGARSLRMREVAHAACVSVGTLYYYYFPTKHDLVLYGLQPEAVQRHCSEFHERCGHLALADPEAYFHEFIDSFIDGILIIQPAMRAAIELGVQETQNSLDAISEGLTGPHSGLCRALRLVVPQVDDFAFTALLQATRRLVLGAVVDAGVTATEFRSEFLALYQWYANPVPSIVNTAHAAD